MNGPFLAGGALREQLMDPALFKVFCEEFARELNRVRAEARTGVDAAKTEIKQIDRQLDVSVHPAPFWRRTAHVW
jgi:hypothetical protein